MMASDIVAVKPIFFKIGLVIKFFTANKTARQIEILKMIFIIGKYNTFLIDAFIIVFDLYIIKVFVNKGFKYLYSKYIQ